MRRRKFLLGLTAGLAGASFLTGTGAFSSTEAERSVEITVVGDDDAFLGLREDEMSDGGVLYGTDTPREAPETFDITNQSAGIVGIDIKLQDGELKFTDADADDTDVENVDVEDDHLTIRGMNPGAKVSDVTVAISGTTSGESKDILSFDVTGEDHGLHIEADRELSLKPDTTTETANFGLCRGENNNICWDVVLTIEQIDFGSQTETEIELTASERSGDGEETYEEKIIGDGSKTIHLTELNNGNWNAGDGPGQTTTMGSVTIDTAVQGGDSVSVTVSVDN